MPINRGARGIAIEIEIDDRNCLDNQVVNFTKQNFLETSYREYISYSGSPLWTSWSLRSVWPDVGIKSSQDFSIVAQKEATEGLNFEVPF